MIAGSGAGRYMGLASLVVTPQRSTATFPKPLRRTANEPSVKLLPISKTKLLNIKKRQKKSQRHLQTSMRLILLYIDQASSLRTLKSYKTSVNKPINRVRSSQ